MPVSVVPLCSPKLVKSGLYPLRTPADLVYHTLLHDETRYKGRPDWAVWLKKAGIKGVDPRHGLSFSNLSLVLQAAADGQGVALGLMPLAQADIDSGRLVIPFEPIFQLDYGYSILCQPGTEDNPNYELFSNWLTAKGKESW
jgi:LysR family glycine cleavage system transcriptional activator